MNSPVSSVDRAVHAERRDEQGEGYKYKKIYVCVLVSASHADLVPHELQARGSAKSGSLPHIHHMPWWQYMLSVE